MAINTNVSNQIATHTLSAGLSIGGGAWAGSMFGPIGAAGGALFGATSYLVGAGTKWAVSKLCDTNDVNLNGAAHLIANIIRYAVPFFAAMGALMLAGIPITIGSAIVLSIVSVIASIPLACGLFCCCSGPHRPANGQQIEGQ